MTEAELLTELQNIEARIAELDRILYPEAAPNPPCEHRPATWEPHPPCVFCGVILERVTHS